MTRFFHIFLLSLALGVYSYADQVVLAPTAHPCVIKASQDVAYEFFRIYPGGAPSNDTYYKVLKLIAGSSGNNSSAFKARWKRLMDDCKKAYPDGRDPWFLQSEWSTRQTVASSGTVLPPDGTAIADFTGDGIPDALMLDSNRFIFQAGQSDRTLGAGTQRTFGNDTNSWGYIETADLNGDSKLDAILCCAPAGANPRVGIALGNGNGTFQAPTLSLNANVMFVRDWNGDGRADLIHATTGSLNIALGQPNGTFQITHQVPFAFARALAVGDMDNDKILDIIALQESAFSVYPGLPNGTLGTPLNHTLPFGGANTMTIADLTGDQTLDIAIFNTIDGIGQYRRGLGTGFLEPVSLFATMRFDRAAAEDLDEDGRADLMLPGGPAGTVTLAPLLPNGELRAPPLYRIPAAGVALQPAPTAATVADITKDGIADVIVGGANTITVYRGGSSIQHLTPISTPINLSGLTALVSGDFNGDSFKDVAGLDGPRLLYMTGAGTGAFGASFTPLSFSPRDIAVADFNGDGADDVAIAGGNGISVASSAGGSFQTPSMLPTSGNPLRIAVGDLNGDQRPDIAYVAFGTAGFFLNQGNGGFSQVVNINVPANFQLTTIHTGDINSDGRTDLLIGGIFVDQGPLLVMLGNGNGTFNILANQKGIDEFIQDIQFADLDHDGRTDLVMAQCCGDLSVSYAYGNGNGTFSPTTRVPTGKDPSRVWLADVTGDQSAEWISFNVAGVSITPALQDRFRQIANVNASSGIGPEVAAQSIVSAYGSQLATSSAATTTLTETTLANTQVWVTDRLGNGGAAMLYYVSPGLINYVLPSGLVNGSGRVTVESSGVLVAEGNITIAAAAPGLSVFYGAGLAAANIFRLSGGANSVEDVYTLQNGSIVAKPISFGPPSDSLVLVLYGTGIRGRSSLSQVTVTVGGVALTPVYAGAQPTYPGLDQINVTLPRSLAGRGRVDVSVTVDGKTSNVTGLVFQ